MATNKQLEAKIRQLEAAFEQLGLAPIASAPSGDPHDRPDFIEWGSPEHAIFLGLVVLKEGDPAPMGQQHILPGQIPGNLYCLEDELGALRFHPGLSLDEVVPVLLRQKIGSFESGAPQVPDSAPPMWTPTPWAEIGT